MINTYSNGFSMGITGASRAPKHNHGPLVNSGPTRNRNRSRNKNGRWRKKRSDTGTTRSNLFGLF